MSTGRQSGRWLRVAVAITVAALGVAVPGSAGATAVATSPAAQTAFAQIGGCLAGSDRLSVALVVDESASLQDSDPQSKRTDGLLAALDGLASLQKFLPEKQIEVASATFSDLYRPAVGWGPAEGGHLEDLRRFATQDVPELDQGTATDYRAAMLGAQRALNENGAACKVMLWFTDGGLDVGDSAAATAAALKEICQPGGISDALRSDDVHVVAAALFSEGSAQVTDEDRANLARVAEGTSADGTCGTVPIPDGFALGSYVSANDPTALSALFAALLAQISGFTPSQDAECPSSECVSGVLRFPIDPGIDLLRIITSAADGAPSYTITTPAGDSASLQPNGSADVGGFTGTTSTSGRTTQVDLDLRSAPAQGEWSFTVQQGTARVGIFLQSTLLVALQDAGQRLNGDAATTVPFTITPLGSGTAIDPAVYGAFAVTGSLDGGTSIPVGRDGQQWLLEIPPPSSGDLPSSRLLTVRVEAKTKPSGLALQPVVRQFDLPVSVSAAYPTIVSSSLVMSAVSGDGTTTGALELRGSELGATKACVAPVTVVGPQGQQDVVLTPEQECLQLGPDEAGTITFAAPVNAVTDGAMAGQASVTLTGYRPQDGPVVFSVPARLGIERPIDEGVRWALVVILLVLSLLVPLLLVYFMGRRLARLSPETQRVCRVLRVAVVLQFDGLRAALTREGGPLQLTHEDVGLHVPPAQQGSEVWDVAGLRFQTSFQFFGRRSIGRLRVPVLALQPSATAALIGGGGRVLTSSQNPYVVGGDSTRAPASLWPERAWFLIFNEADLQRAKGTTQESGSIPAQLLMLIPDTSPTSEAERGRALAQDHEMPRRMLDAALRQPLTAPAAVPAYAGGTAADLGFDDEFGGSAQSSSAGPVGDDFGNDFAGGPQAPQQLAPRPASRQHPPMPPPAAQTGPSAPGPSARPSGSIDDSNPDW